MSCELATNVNGITASLEEEVYGVSMSMFFALRAYLAQRLPFYYGWAVLAVAACTCSSAWCGPITTAANIWAPSVASCCQCRSVARR